MRWMLALGFLGLGAALWLGMADEQAKARHPLEMDCVKTWEKRPNMDRCENQEVLCYRSMGDGMVCWKK